MAYTQRRGKYVHAYYLKANGKYGSKSKDPDTGRRFADDDEATAWAIKQEWKERLGLGEGEQPDPDETTVGDWFARWWRGLDVGLRSQRDYAYIFRAHVLPEWGHWKLRDIKASDVNAWEKRMIAAGYGRGGVVKNARARLTTLLADAVTEKLLDSNPAQRTRGRGRRSGVKPREEEKVWSTPLQALLVAERAAILSGRDDEFILIQTIFWTGARWGETVGLQRKYVSPGKVDIEWQLQEIKNRWYVAPPKDDSYRTLDVPPYLQSLLDRQIAAHPDHRCTCDHPASRSVERPCPGGGFIFLGPLGGHLRNSNIASRYWIPAADGRYVTSKGERSPDGKPVLVDADTLWPGTPIPPWPRAVRGEPYERPPARGYRRRPARLGVNAASSRTDLVQYAITQGVARAAAEDMTRDQILDRFIRPGYVSDDTAIASWAPVKDGLTFHGLRHGHSTLLDGLGTPVRLRDDRIGHASPDMPRASMRRRYTHVADEWRTELRAKLQQEALKALAERAWFGLRSPVAVLDDLLAPFRDGKRKPISPRSSSATVIEFARKTS